MGQQLMNKDTLITGRQLLLKLPSGNYLNLISVVEIKFFLLIPKENYVGKARN